METTAVDAAVLAGSVGATDFSMLSLFLRADLVVKAVIILLVIASVGCWAIIFEKVMAMRKLNQRANDFEGAFWSGGSLDDLYERIGVQPSDPMSAVFVAAMREWRRNPQGVAEPAVSMVTLGERIGMMKFGSRLDMTFPSEGLQVRVGLGQRVKAGETIVATITQT